MAKLPKLDPVIFLDTSYAIALSAPSDDLHSQAILLADSLECSSTRLVTTQAILLEIGNALAKQRHRSAAIALLLAIETDAQIEVVPITQDFYSRGFQLYSTRLDKEWGLVDCISFIVMQEQNITSALTADEHFQQAGFRVLLR